MTERPADLVARLDQDFDVVRLVEVQRRRTYGFGDVLVARAGGRQTASRAGRSGRHVEDEIEAMADVRLPRQYVLAVVDGIGWKSRLADLRRLYALWEDRQIDGMYTLASLDRFRADVAEAAHLRGLL